MSTLNNAKETIKNAIKAKIGDANNYFLKRKLSKKISASFGGDSSWDMDRKVVKDAVKAGNFKVAERYAKNAMTKAIDKADQDNKNHPNQGYDNRAEYFRKNNKTKNW